MLGIGYFSITLIPLYMAVCVRIVITSINKINYYDVGLFSRHLYFANSQFNSCSRKIISQMEIAPPPHFSIFED